jgi:hypothetical protein
MRTNLFFYSASMKLGYIKINFLNLCLSSWGIVPNSSQVGIFLDYSSILVTKCQKFPKIQGLEEACCVSFLLF